MSSKIIGIETQIIGGNYLSQDIPRRANFRGVGKAWILEEVSLKKDTWEPFIQYLKFDDPHMDRAIRFGYYVLEKGKRTRMLGNVFFELGVLEDLKRQIDETKAHAIKNVLKEVFG